MKRCTFCRCTYGSGDFTHGKFCSDKCKRNHQELREIAKETYPNKSAEEIEEFITSIDLRAKEEVLTIDRNKRLLYFELNFGDIQKN